MRRAHCALCVPRVLQGYGGTQGYYNVPRRTVPCAKLWDWLVSRVSTAAELRVGLDGVVCVHVSALMVLNVVQQLYESCRTRVSQLLRSCVSALTPIPTS
jgi:hypothetical protein